MSDVSGDLVHTKNLTIRVTNGVAQIIERRRKVVHLVLDCQYLCDLAGDQEGHCWAADHSGPRCAPAQYAKESDDE